MYCKMTRNGKNLKSKTCSKYFDPVQKITMCPKSFGQVQNILDAFKKILWEQMDRTLD